MKRISSKLMLLVLVMVFTLSTPLAFASSSLPDLRITGFSITSETPTVISYTCTIKNSGTETIPSLYYVSIQNFYSENTIFNDAGDVAAGGMLLGGLGVNRSLAPGETFTFNFAAYGQVPANMSYLTAKIDWSGTVTELNENNNTIAIAIN